MNIVKRFLTRNDCYKANKKMKPTHIVVHDVGCDNKTIDRFWNSWNNPNVYKCVHAFIGVDSKGDVAIHQTLPFDIKPWGCGSGSKGSYNDCAIQFEICRVIKDTEHTKKAYSLAVEFCAYLCKEYNIPIKNIVGHYEAHALGYGSNHADPRELFNSIDKSMDIFRANVDTLLNKPSTFKVKILCDSLNVRKGVGILHKKVTTVKKNEVFTIIETDGNWGKLKSGAGWINISSKYVTKL